MQSERLHLDGGCVPVLRPGSTVATAAAARYINPRVAIRCAGLRDFPAWHHELGSDVVLEGARGLAAVHHAREAVFHTGPRDLGMALVLALEVWEALWSPLRRRSVALGLVGALDLREVDELLGALYPRHVQNRRVVLALARGQAGTGQPHFLVPAILAQGDQRITCLLHGTAVDGIHWQLGTSFAGVHAAIHTAPSIAAPRVHAACAAGTGVESAGTTHADLEVELAACHVVPGVDGLRDDLLAQTLDAQPVASSNAPLWVFTCPVGAHPEEDVLTIRAIEAGLGSPHGRASERPIHTCIGHIAPFGPIPVARAVVANLTSCTIAHDTRSRARVKATPARCATVERAGAGKSPGVVFVCCQKIRRASLGGHQKCGSDDDSLHGAGESSIGAATDDALLSV
mmetsp:Transcript_24166/g.68448  ORF Transcript_24166/g.68448 Transcript_24166/m.68448 type:complete len:401 (-) Transcript_24166:32-1234(-)